MNLPPLSYGERAALAFLLRTAAKYGPEKCWPKIYSIGLAIRKKPRTVSRIMTNLTAFGIIERVGRGPKSNEYRIRLDDAEIQKILGTRLPRRPSRFRGFVPASYGESWAAKRRHLLPVLGQRQRWSCFYCWRAGDESVDPDGRTWHLDHKHPELRGTSEEDADLVLACADCNIRKGPASAEEFSLAYASKAAKEVWGFQ